MSLERWSAQFAPCVINADGLRKLLGASDHDALSLLVRETIQNSWDASRSHDGSPIVPDTRPYYGLDLRTLQQSTRCPAPDARGRSGAGLDSLERALKGAAHGSRDHRSKLVRSRRSGGQQDRRLPR